jgi:hypothetical protein
MNNIAISTLTLCLVGLWLLSGIMLRHKVVIETAEEKGAVQIEYVCSGPRQSIFSDESRDGIWLRLRNNSDRTLFIRTYRKPRTKTPCAREAGSEVGLQYEVVEKESYTSEEKEIKELPAGRLKPETHVVIKVKPHNSIVFSAAREHLSLNRAIYITFWYAQPKQELRRAYFYAFELPANEQKSRY